MAAFAGIKVQPKAKKPKVIKILSNNMEALQLFLKLATQWNIAPMGEYIGLNYQSVETILRVFSVQDKINCFKKIQVLENEYLKVMGEKRESKNPL